ncbi:hypothetical protein [Gaoshiqia sp. Z1-71]|uniref:hypothetical protein n=1 Tax=Gaoshiqia hydrogeniformans TaxID=3290090 RepID=UPI003BF8D4A7
MLNLFQHLLPDAAQVVNDRDAEIKHHQVRISHCLPKRRAGRLSAHRLRRFSIDDY